MCPRNGLFHSCARGRVVVGRLEAQAELVHARQVVDTVGRAEAQRLPAVLPRATGARPAVEHHETIHLRDRRQPVGDHKGGSALGDVVEVVGDGLLHIEFGVRLQSLQDRDRR